MRCSPGDNRDTPRSCPPRNIRFLSDWSRIYRGVAYVGARVSKMARYRFSLTTSPKPATLLPRQNTSEGTAGHLATLADRRMGKRSGKVRVG